MANFGVRCGWLVSFVLACLLLRVASNGYLKRECCWGDTVIPHGHSALNMPWCCTELRCNNGLLETLHVGGPGETDCCEFNGVLYPNGGRLAAHCVALICSRGRWTVAEVDDCCAHCSVYDDPHFTTFDGHHYDYHGTCNYSLAQTDFSMAPHTAVYSQFKPCFGRASCIHYVTFKENPHTVLTLGLGGPYDVDVNGNEYTVPETGVHVVTTFTRPHPVLAWRDNGCVHLLGASKIMILHCPHSLEIWAFPTHASSLDGLCGHFNFYADDDLTSRSGQVTSLTKWPLAFPESWKTPDQTNQSCYKECDYCPAETTDPCRASPVQRRHNLAACRRALHPPIGRDVQLAHYIDSCTFDLCMLDQSGASARREEWIIIIIIIIYTPKRTIARIEDQWEPTEPPSHGTCSPGGRWRQSCNWCTCGNSGTSASCTIIACAPDFVPDLGEAVCEDGSWWRPDYCNWCLCVRGGAICTHLECAIITLPTQAPTIPTVPGTSVCFLPKDSGPCYNFQTRFYYNPVTYTCESFQYGGCDGNLNNFLSHQECSRRCNLTPTPTIPFPTQPPTVPDTSVCFLPKNSGPCDRYEPRYHYSLEGGQCLLFLYGGCPGNDNNFMTLQECLTTCSGVAITGTPTTTPRFPVLTTESSLPPRCRLAKELGDCYNFVLKFYYNTDLGQCSIFFYSGCGGNDNNFETVEECNQTCRSTY